MSSSVAFLTIGEQAKLIRERRLSPVEIVEEYLARIERFDGELRSYITVSPETALADARRAEAELLRGEDKGALHGIAVAVKDQMRIARLRTTGGSRLFADFVPADDSSIVASLRRDGAVLLGTLNTQEFHMGGTREWPFGRTRNPWDVERNPGGSSAGSAAAVAAGLCAASVGADTGGSIRSPASLCGITGLKPSWSRISRYGMFTLAWPMDCAGPMARSVRDCAILLRTLAGHDPRDPTSSTKAVPDYLAELSDAARGLRVAVVDEMLDDSIEANTRRGVEAAIDVLRGLGVKIERTSLPLISLANVAHSASVDPEAASYHRERLLNRYAEFDYNSRVRLIVGTLLPAGLHTLATRLRAAIAHDVMRRLQQFDLLIGSTSAATAGIIDDEPTIHSKEDAMKKVGARSSPPAAESAALTTAYSMAGVPAISVPCGFADNGLPYGLHIAGRRFEEGRVMGLAHMYQQATDWHHRHPQKYG